MKLGEIKSEAMLLMFPDVNLTCAEEELRGKISDTASDITVTSEENDGTEISDLLFALASDSNYSSYLNGMVGSINRCFSYLESHFLIPAEYAELKNGRSVGDKMLFDLPDDVFCIERVAFSGEGEYIGNTGFEYVASKTIAVPKMRGNGVFTAVFIPHLERIKRTTSDFYDIPLPDSVSEIIPYFIKGDLFENDDAEGAAEARRVFENCVSAFANCHSGYSASVEEKYSMGSLQ